MTTTTRNSMPAQCRADLTHVRTSERDDAEATTARQAVVDAYLLAEAALPEPLRPRLYAAWNGTETLRTSTMPDHEARIVDRLYDLASAVREANRKHSRSDIAAMGRNWRHALAVLRRVCGAPSTPAPAFRHAPGPSVADRQRAAAAETAAREEAARAAASVAAKRAARVAAADAIVAELRAAGVDASRLDTDVSVPGAGCWSPARPQGHDNAPVRHTLYCDKGRWAFIADPAQGQYATAIDAARQAARVGHAPRDGALEWAIIV